MAYIDPYNPEGYERISEVEWYRRAIELELTTVIWRLKHDTTLDKALEAAESAYKAFHKMMESLDKEGYEAQKSIETAWVES